MGNNSEANYVNKNGKVVEKSTGYVVYLTKSRKDATLMTNWLNAGGGFDGWTPRFFLDKRIQEKK